MWAQTTQAGTTRPLQPVAGRQGPTGARARTGPRAGAARGDAAAGSAAAARARAPRPRLEGAPVRALDVAGAVAVIATTILLWVGFWAAVERPAPAPRPAVAAETSRAGAPATARSGAP